MVLQNFRRCRHDTEYMECFTKVFGDRRVAGLAFIVTQILQRMRLTRGPKSPNLITDTGEPEHKAYAEKIRT